MLNEHTNVSPLEEKKGVGCKKRASELRVELRKERVVGWKRVGLKVALFSDEIVSYEKRGRVCRVCK